MNRMQRALDAFAAGHNCSQAILIGYGPDHGLQVEKGIALGSCFGGGMGRALTCGAVTGSLMVLGLHSGPRCETGTDRSSAGTASAAFLRLFSERCGGLQCAELLGCDLSTAAGLARAKEMDLFRTRCPQMITAACELLDDLLQ